MLTYRSLFALLVISSTQATAAFCQTVRGTVLDDSTSRPIGAAEVTAVDSLGVAVTQALSDSAGQFELSLAPGDYIFRVLRIGYTPTVTTVLHATGDVRAIDVVIRITSSSALRGDGPYALSPVVVEAPPAERYLAGYYRHQDAGQGEFAHRDEFEQWHPRDVTDVLLRMRTFSILPNPHHGLPFPDGRIDMRELIIDVHGRRHSSSGECPPLIYLDGTAMGNAQSIDINTLPLDAIEAVETFARPVQTPIEYHRPGNECGVVALWTRAAASGDAGSPFELGLRYGGTVAGGPFTGGRIGVHLVSGFKGRFEFYPAVYLVSSAFSEAASLENSGWMVQIALRTMIRERTLPLYVGTGLLLRKRGPWFMEQQSGSIDASHTLFAGLKHELGPIRPFLELHVVDLFAFSSVSAQTFFGFGIQF